MEKNYYELAIEVTRRCNMHCAHCIRGRAQRRDIPNEYIDRMLRNTRYISSLLLTGGEPSLNPSAIRFISDTIRRKHITLGSVVLITNAKKITDEFLAAYAELLSITTDPSENYLAISKDEFHDAPSDENRRKLALFACYIESAQAIDWHKSRITNLGRARKLDGYSKCEPCYSSELSYAYDPDAKRLTFTDSIITLTVDGDILDGCDYEYASTGRLKIGHVSDPKWAEHAIGIGQRVCCRR